MMEEKQYIEKKKIGIGWRILFVLLGFIIVVFGFVLVLRSIGKSKLTSSILEDNVGITLGETAQEALGDNAILYNGKAYTLNEDLVTILVMGIDKETVTEVGGQSWTADETGEFAGGQADALFLMVIDPHKKNVSVIAINRNSMADVDVFDEDGNYKGIYTEQIALQHGYGDGGEESCLRQVKAVSRMFHNIPINAYVAISMDAIPELTDAVGGVTVEVLDDVIYPEYNMDLHQGDVVTLHGEQAYWYVRLRNENVFDSNSLRLQRQKQYLTTFAAEAKNQCKSDVRIAVKLYNTLQVYMVTDIDLSTFTYMATEYIDYNFDINNLYSLEGESMQGNKFEEYYVDDAALQQLIVDLFYEPVE